MEVREIFDLQNKYRKKRIIFAIIFLIVIVLLTLIFINLNSIVAYFDKKSPYLDSKQLIYYDKDKNSVLIKFFVNDNVKKDIYVSSFEEESSNEFVKCEDDFCLLEFRLDKNYFVRFKDQSNNLSEVYNAFDGIDKLLDLKMRTDTYYIALGDSVSLSYELIGIGNYNKSIIWSYDDNILSIKSGVIKGLKEGRSKVSASIDNINLEFDVVVTSLVTSPKIDTKKPFLGCYMYNNAEAHLLDEILFSRVSNALEKTRAGVVAAARFLTLEFPYRINYFPENGRLTNEYRKVDGEGRYYHKGLYLSEDKFDDISYSSSGPVIWGCPLLVTLGEEDQPAGNYYPNGLDCSGFIAWAFLNGGFDVGDIGAGFSNNYNFSQLGKKYDITYNFLKSGKVKAGDLIGIDGHIAIIIGIDDKNIYVAETLFYNTGVTVLKYTYESLAYTNYFTYIILMDDYYKEDGNYTNMW